MMDKQGLNTDRLVEIAKKHGIVYLAIFGSYARGEAGELSDVDLYVRFGRHVSLFETLAVKYEMEDTVGRKIDLIAEEIVEPYEFVREGMIRDLVVLYEGEREVHGAAQ